MALIKTVSKVFTDFAEAIRVADVNDRHEESGWTYEVTCKWADGFGNCGCNPDPCIRWVIRVYDENGELVGNL